MDGVDGDGLVEGAESEYKEDAMITRETSKKSNTIIFIF